MSTDVFSVSLQEVRDRIGVPPYEERDRINLGTSHLPDEAVAQELVSAVWVGTNPENVRQCSISLSFRLGGRDNPHLTDDEAKYVAAAHLYAAERILGMHGGLRLEE